MCPTVQDGSDKEPPGAENWRRQSSARLRQLTNSVRIVGGSEDLHFRRSEALAEALQVCRSSLHITALPAQLEWTWSLSIASPTP